MGELCGSWGNSLVNLFIPMPVINYTFLLYMYTATYKHWKISFLFTFRSNFEQCGQTWFYIHEERGTFSQLLQIRDLMLLHSWVMIKKKKMIWKKRKHPPLEIMHTRFKSGGKISWMHADKLCFYWIINVGYSTSTPSSIVTALI